MGKDLIMPPRDADDYDDIIDIDDTCSSSTEAPLDHNLKDAVTEEHPKGKYCPWFKLDSKQIYKAQYLSQAFSNYKKPSSTDRLKRVANIQCYAMKLTNVYDSILDHWEETSYKWICLLQCWSIAVVPYFCALGK